MSQQEKKFLFNKSINNKNKTLIQNKQDVDLDSKRRAAKDLLMKKYNLSENEAEKQLQILEKKKINGSGQSNKKFIKQNKVSSKSRNSDNKNQNKKTLSDKKLKNVQQSKKQLKQNIDSIKLDNGEGSNNEQKFINNSSEKDKKDQQRNSSLNKVNETISKNTKVSVNQDVSANKIGENVDLILEGIIPDYNRHISIELNNVNLVFETQTDKIDNIKEEFIRTLKRNKGETKRIQALKNVSFKIYKGEKVGIIGYNGAGKSTLLNVIAGIYPIDSGSIKTYGKISPLLGLGAGFDYNYSGSRNIFLNGAMLGYEREFIESKYDEIVEFSELGEYINLPIKNYSNGMLAKLGFSVATIVEPDILIIDEILGVGDVNFNKKSNAKMRSLMDGGTTVILVSHSLPQIRELCDKAIWIDNGEVREIGDVNKVCDNYLRDSEKASKKQLANIKLIN